MFSATSIALFALLLQFISLKNAVTIADVILVPEGIVGRVAYKGILSEVTHQIIGGLKSGMGYCGANNIEELLAARFVKITSSGMTESHPHNVTITRESPNYSRR